MKKLAFIFNPHAGRERLRPKVGDVIVEFANAGYEVITAPTAKRGDAVELAENFSMRADIDRIVCAGGDGTLDEVVTGVLSAEKKLGESFAQGHARVRMGPLQGFSRYRAGWYAPLPRRYRRCYVQE